MVKIRNKKTRKNNSRAPLRVPDFSYLSAELVLESGYTVLISYMINKYKNVRLHHLTTIGNIYQAHNCY